MNWEAAGAVGEIVGAFGVIASLIYLASQIRTQNRESRMAAVTEWTTQWNDWVVSFAEHPQVAEVWTKGSQDFDSLSRQEVVQFGAHVGRLFRVAEGLHGQYVQGRLDPDSWRGLERTLEDVASHPGVKTWWPTRAHWYTDRFGEFIQPYIDSDEPQHMYRE